MADLHTQPGSRPKDTKPLTVLELFCGSKSFSNAARSLGHRTFTSDYDPLMQSDYCVDILDFDVNEVPFQPDIIWASPPCESFSIASVRHHWNPDRSAKSNQAQRSLEYVKKTLEIIEELQPRFYFIENPRGMLRKQMSMGHIPYRHTITYCRYGDSRMKPTDIWTNCDGWKPKWMCSPNSKCHSSAPRGSNTGTQGMRSYYEKSMIPREFRLDVLTTVTDLVTLGFDTTTDSQESANLTTTI